MTSDMWDQRAAPGVAEPRRRSARGDHEVLSEYPTYLTPARPRPQPETGRSPLVTVAGTYALAFVARRVAGIPLGWFVVAYGTASLPMTGHEASQKAAIAALATIGGLMVAWVAAAWVFLRFRRVQGAFLVAFLGMAADFTFSVVGNLVSDGLSRVAGAIAAVAVMYALVRLRKNPR